MGRGARLRHLSRLYPAPRGTGNAARTFGGFPFIIFEKRRHGFVHPKHGPALNLSRLSPKLADGGEEQVCRPRGGVDLGSAGAAAETAEAGRMADKIIPFVLHRLSRNLCALADQWAEIAEVHLAELSSLDLATLRPEELHAAVQSMRRLKAVLAARRADVRASIEAHRTAARRELTDEDIAAIVEHVAGPDLKVHMR